VLRLEDLSQRERGRPAQWQSEYGDILSALAAPNLRIAAMRAGLLYTFPDDLAPSGACAAINESNAYLLHNGLEEWLPDVATGQPLLRRLRVITPSRSVRRSPALKVLTALVLKPLPHTGEGALPPTRSQGGHARCANWEPPLSTARPSTTSRLSASHGDSACRWWRPSS
jgi:hypothetical protein